MCEKISFLKSTVLILLTSLMISCVSSSNESRPSPYAMDSTVIEGVRIAIKYSSPGVKKRTIWGDLVPYGNMWRTGANEATSIEISEDVTLNDQLIKKGKYAILTIPEEQQWTIIFNKDWNQWGAYNYNEEMDALRLTVNPSKTKEFQERMQFFFEENNLIFHWENLTFNIEIGKP